MLNSCFNVTKSLVCLSVISAFTSDFDIFLYAGEIPGWDHLSTEGQVSCFSEM